MQQFWIDAGNSKLYQNWWGGVIDGLFTKGGIYDSKPMKDFIQKEFVNTQVKRATDIGIVDVLSGQYLPFTEKNLTTGDNLINSLYASFALPGFFPPVEAFGSKWFDGSAVYDLDIFSAVNRCTEKGFKQADIVIDVLLTSSAGLKTVDAHDYKSISMLFRFLEINSYYSSMDGLLRAKFAYP
jgi:predicted acylesterase/phospholipase RssA